MLTGMLLMPLGRSGEAPTALVSCLDMTDDEVWSNLRAGMKIETLVRCSLVCTIKTKSCPFNNLFHKFVTFFCN